jgi:hypothetical protein
MVPAITEAGKKTVQELDKATPPIPAHVTPEFTQEQLRELWLNKQANEVPAPKATFNAGLLADPGPVALKQSASIEIDF